MIPVGIGGLITHANERRAQYVEQLTRSKYAHTELSTEACTAAARSLRLSFPKDRIYLFVHLFIVSFTCISSSSGDWSNTSTAVSQSRGILHPEVVGSYLNENDVLVAERPRPVCGT